MFERTYIYVGDKEMSLKALIQSMAQRIQDTHLLHLIDLQADN